MRESREPISEEISMENTKIRRNPWNLQEILTINYFMNTFLLEEGGKEGKRGPFRGQNFSRLEEGCPRVGGATVGGRGWSEGSTPGEAGEKKKNTTTTTTTTTQSINSRRKVKKGRKGHICVLFVYP